MGFETNGVSAGGGGGGTGDLTGTLTAGRIPVANGLKSLTNSDSTYVGGVLTLRAVSGVAKLTIDATDVTSLDGATINVRSSAGHINILSNQSIYFTSANITNNRVPFIGTSGRFETGTTTSTELSFLTGVTSPIQTQINSKLSGSFTVGYVPIATGTNTLGDSDAIYKSGTSLFVSRGTSYLQVENNFSLLRTDIGGISTFIFASAGTATMQAASVSQDSTIDVSPTSVIIGSDVQININAPSVYLNQITANRALVTVGGSQVAASVTTATEISYVSGVTSSIQAQLNGKISGSLTAGYMPYATGTSTIANTGLFYNGTNRWGFLTSAPDTTVHIVGSLKFVDTNQAAGKVLTSDAAGVATWQVPNITNPMTTLGDIIYGGSSGVPTRLGVGSNGQVLTVVSGIPAWATPTSGFANPMTTKGDIIQADTAGAPTRLAAVTTGNVFISGGVGAFNSWGKVGLNTHTSGVLQESSGGTNITTYSTGDLIVGLGSGLTKVGIGTTGQVLTVVGGTVSWQTSAAGFSNPMTTTGDIIQSSPGSTPTRLAAVATGNVLISGGVGAVNSWGKVGLTTHVSGILPQANGGTGASTSPTAGAIPFQGGSSAYTYDATNFNYDSATKTLNVQSIYVTPGPGVVGQTIYTTTSYGQQIVTAGGGIDIVNTAGLSPGININSLSKGIVLQTSDTSVDATSALIAGIFAQVGTLATGTTTTANTVSIYRNYTLNGTASVTGSMLELNDSSTASGNFLTVIKQNSTKFAIKSTGIMQYLDGSQGAGKVLTSDASGNVSWATPSGGTSYTFSTGLTNTSNVITNNLSTGVSGGQSVVGGTAASNALTLSSTTNATKGKILFGTAGNSVYNEANDRLGVGTNLPGARFDVWITNGGNCFRIVNSDATTAAGGTIVGWQWTPITNGSNTNLSMYENTAAGGFLNRVIYHAGGNVTIGAGSGSGDARLHVIGTIKVQDGSEGVGKVLTSDVNGLATWTTPSSGFANPMTTIGDIIQANTGGTPQRLAGSATAGTFLRSGGSGSLNSWSTLVLPNSITTGYILVGTATNTVDSSAEFQYLSSVGSGAVTKSQNASTSWGVINSNAGGSALAALYVGNGSGSIYLRKEGTGAGANGELAFDGTEFRITAGSASTVLRFIQNSTEQMRITTGGVSVGSGANPDITALLDLTSTTKGLRFPRMTTSQRTAITTTSKPGIVVFDTDTNQLMVTNNAGSWVAL